MYSIAFCVANCNTFFKIHEKFSSSKIEHSCHSVTGRLPQADGVLILAKNGVGCRSVNHDCFRVQCVYRVIQTVYEESAILQKLGAQERHPGRIIPPGYGFLLYAKLIGLIGLSIL